MFDITSGAIYQLKIWTLTVEDPKKSVVVVDDDNNVLLNNCCKNIILLIITIFLHCFYFRDGVE